MEYLTIVSSFLSGLFVALIAALIKVKLDQSKEVSVKLKEAEYEMFLKLNDLYNWYFWFSTNELHKKETPKEIVGECHSIAQELAKLLHANERTEFAKELMKILHDESYPTYDARWKHMFSLAEKMGDKVVPLHRKYLKEIGDSNIHIMASSEFVAKAPVSPRFKIGV